MRLTFLQDQALLESRDPMKTYFWGLIQWAKDNETAKALQREAENHIGWAQSTLRGPDGRPKYSWINYYLTNARAWLAQSGQGDGSKSDTLFKDGFDPAKFRPKTWGLNDPMAPGKMKGQLEHFLGIQAQKIQNAQPRFERPSELLDEWRRIEQAWAERQARRIDMSMDEKAEPLVDCSNGMVWFNLNRPSCDIEAAAMGHCGNRGAYEGDDTILSLRENTKDYDVWEPHLTFILDDLGLLGEMKGRQNEKPDPKYHQCIVKLLLSNPVQGIKGGGYLPEHNFELNDLPDETIQMLIKKKPWLGGPQHVFKNPEYQPTEKDYERFMLFLEDFQRDYADRHETPMMYSDGTIVLDFYKSMDELLEVAGNDTAQWASKVISGGEEMYDDYAPSGEDPQDWFYHYADEKSVQATAELVRKTGWDGPLDDEHEIMDAIQEMELEPILDAMRKAAWEASRVGAESEMCEDYAKAVRDFDSPCKVALWNGPVRESRGGGYPTGNMTSDKFDTEQTPFGDDPVILVSSTDLMVEAMTPGSAWHDHIVHSEGHYWWGDKGEAIKLEQYNQWYGHDKEAGNIAYLDMFLDEAEQNLEDQGFIAQDAEQQALPGINAPGEQVT